ncbi:phenylalanyl-tRNA synthetase [Phellopilus nigrolimitatus]|nr:phenylalanyl-tRNA synthetase [Phellopilus nigrolimitatus]
MIGRLSTRTPRRASAYLWLHSTHCRRLSTPAEPASIDVLGTRYPTDSYTNVTPAILARLGAGLAYRRAHPLSTLRARIEAHFGPGFARVGRALPAVVAPAQNFDELSFPADHPGRARADSYYVNARAMLRTHASAHEVAVFAAGHRRWLLTADVFRRDEVDASHYPVFHQMEGARLFRNDPAASGAALRAENAQLSAALAGGHVALADETRVDAANPYQPGHDPALAELVTQNLKYSLSLLLLELFAGAAGASAREPLQIRWIPAYFPFTSPSYEVEVLFRGKWLEILGCGVVQQATLAHAKVHDEIGWAFGLGLERIAMILYSIPDIRLFWSEDPRFLSQFEEGKITTFKPYSKYPSCWKDVTFWLPENFHSNDFCDLVRVVAGDLVEEVDQFTHPKTKRNSASYRVVYRSMDRQVQNKEANILTEEIKSRAAQDLGVEIR